MVLVNIVWREHLALHHPILQQYFSRVPAVGERVAIHTTERNYPYAIALVVGVVHFPAEENVTDHLAAEIRVE